jgi:hypothetical protein
MGGLGLLELKSFLSAQRCAWIQRALDLNEKWKLNLFFRSNGNLTNLRKSFIDKNSTPVLYGIVESFEDFVGGFSKHNENFWESGIFENNAHMVSLRQKLRLTKTFFGEAFFSANKEKIINLKISDFYVNKDSLVRFENFCNTFNIELTREQFNKLKDMCIMAKKKYSKTCTKKMKCERLMDFLVRRKKGCKRYRKRLIGEVEEYIPHNMVKFAETTDTIIDIQVSKKLNSIWSNTALGNGTRTFLFKLHNNTAGYNLAVSHFVRGHSPNCTFCDILDIAEINNETPLHLFFQCPAVENLTNEIFSWLLGTNTVISRQELFTVFNRDDHRKNDFLTIFSKLLLKYYWDCKQRFYLPTLTNAQLVLKSEVKTLLHCNLKLRTIYDNSGIDIYRE